MEYHLRNLGGETLVNSKTSGVQQVPEIAALTSGGYVVVWQDRTDVSSASEFDVRGQRFDADGNKLGGEFMLSSSAVGGQAQPSVAALSTGGFIAAWADNSGDPAFSDVKAQRFDESGNPVGPAFVVNSVTAGPQSSAAVTELTSGNIVVTWRSATSNDINTNDVKAQLFDATGNKLGGEFLVSTGTDFSQNDPAIVALPSGGFAVSWTAETGNSVFTSPANVKLQLFSGTGAKVGSEITVNSALAENQAGSSIAVLSSGDFVVTWQQFEHAGDTSEYGLFAQRFDSSGNKLGGEILVNTTLTDSQQTPKIVALADGGFVIGWADDSGIGGDASLSGIKAQQFDANGIKVGGELLINSTTIGNQSQPVLAVLESGRLVTAWTDTSGQNGDSDASIVSRLIGVHGSAAVLGTASANVMTGTAGNDILNGLGGNDRLDGGLGDDVLIGDAGNDELTGGGGYDLAVGGAGDDIFYVGSRRDDIVELAGEGNDVVYASVSYTLASGVSVETLSTVLHAGTTAIDLTGNELNNRIFGNAGANILNGGGGADSFFGFAGNDIYYVDNASDFVNDGAGQGNDIVYASISYELSAGIEVEMLSTIRHADSFAIDLTGNEFNNRIFGNAGANILNGGGGADSFFGFAGDDTYYIDNSNDFVNDGAGQGNDIVYASISFGLSAGVEVETLSTIRHADSFAIDLTGNEFNNRIFGNAGANILNGGGGADSFFGFAGDDIYYVDNSNDFVNDGAGQGNDIVYASISFGLSAGVEVETLSTIRHADSFAIDLTGNEFNNRIFGNAGANILNGGGGADSFFGFAGDDIYYVDNASDAVNDGAGEGNDTIYSSVSYVLAAGVQVEILSTILHAGTQAINLTGNEFNNRLNGNAGANFLDGGGGADTYFGFAGNDTFAFTTTLNAASNVDRIFDFDTGTDKIALDDAVFAGLQVGALAAGAFIVGAAAADANDRIIYNAQTGALLFDSDGSGAAAAVQFAFVQTGLDTMAASNFVII